MNKEERLKIIVNEVFNIDVMSKTRKNKEVEGRMVYTKILMSEGYKNLSTIARSLNKHHATIIHYNKQFKYIIKPDEKLWEMYSRCLRLFIEPTSMEQELNLIECKKLIFSLQNKIKKLTLDIHGLNLEHEVFQKRQSRYPEIYKTIHERVNSNNIKEVTRKLNTYLNGVHR